MISSEHQEKLQEAFEQALCAEINLGVIGRQNLGVPGSAPFILAHEQIKTIIQILQEVTES